MYDLSGLGIGDKADSINITLKGKEGKDAEYNFDLFICRILSNTGRCSREFNICPYYFRTEFINIQVVVVAMKMDGIVFKAMSQTLMYIRST